MRRTSVVVLAALAVGTLSVPAVSAASRPSKASDQGQITVRLLDASVARKDDPRARIYIDDHLKPGDTIVRHVDVSNSASHPVALKFYADAASVAKAAFLPAPGRGVNELTNWTTVTPSSATLPGNGHIVLTVRVAVPTDTTAGERYGVVLAEVPPGKAAPGTVALGARVGIRMYISVGKGREPITDFTVTSLTAARDDQGRPRVNAQVRNTGGRAIDLSGTLSLNAGPGGLRAGPYAVTLGTTLGVGQTAPVGVLLDPNLPDGPWHATLTLHSGSVIRAVEGTLRFPSTAGTTSEPVAVKPVPLTRNKDVVIPVAGGLLGLLALTFLLLFLLRRRRRKNKDDDPTAPPTIPQARTADLDEMQLLRG